MSYSQPTHSNSRSHIARARAAGPRAELSPDLGDKERAYVFAVAMKYVKDEEAAADVAQEALLLAHRHRHSFLASSRYSTWLYRIAATTALMHLRSNRRRAREVLRAALREDAPEATESLPDVPLWGAELTAPDRRLEDKQTVQLIERRLAELGDKYQDIFWMRYLEGYTETEIADRLQLTLSTVKTRAHRARVAIRETLIASA